MNNWKCLMAKNTQHISETLSLKYKISAIWLVETASMFLIFLIATVQISMECETQES